MMTVTFTRKLIHTRQDDTSATIAANYDLKKILVLTALKASALSLLSAFSR